MRAAAEADLVMLDPDNGVGPNAKMYQADGPKFCFLADLSDLWGRGQSLVLHQHITRIGEAQAQIRARAETIRDTLEGADPIPLLFHWGTARIFMVICRPEHP